MTSSLDMKVCNCILSLVSLALDWSRAFLAETVETGDKNCIITKAMHRNL